MNEIILGSVNVGDWTKDAIYKSLIGYQYIGKSRFH
jgi:hypothetical protein